MSNKRYNNEVETCDYIKARSKFLYRVYLSMDASYPIMSLTTQVLFICHFHFVERLSILHFMPILD